MEYFLEPLLQVVLAHLVHLEVRETVAHKEEKEPEWHEGLIALFDQRARNQDHDITMS